MLRLLIAALCCCCLLTGCAPVVDPPVPGVDLQTKEDAALWHGAHLDNLVLARHIRIEKADDDPDVPVLVGGWSVYDPDAQPRPRLIRIPSTNGRFWIRYRVNTGGFLSTAAIKPRRR